MTLESALRVTEILLGCALLQQSLEHGLGPRDEQRIALPRALLCAVSYTHLTLPTICSV